ncbi:hypothetical protein FH587_03790 (plasmid) [Leptospira interrogans]|nr:hypothetical protein [Leptospira interrogans]UML82989.1 hypothetical protein FH587_03790 [Leptospira interrogans]
MAAKPATVATAKAVQPTIKEAAVNPAKATPANARPVPAIAPPNINAVEAAAPAPNPDRPITSIPDLIVVSWNSL